MQVKRRDFADTRPFEKPASGGEYSIGKGMAERESVEYQ
jgi:hypothetical protein